MGVAACIEQQRNPEKIDKSAAEARLAGMETLRMSPKELLAPDPAPALLRQIERCLAVRAGMDPEANPNSLSPVAIGNSG